mmetsp:Transcript_3501/g.9961  ORF Transcript_3501/g.9961 Transcript_3501/m.9961 type:complete len:1024 (-) Transcript_3501:509-3580(-)|eukprot:CAMPEP_0181074840 /NCGR_PEP_ID=MMETSP1070-20121207/29803_1 /TAXON_ID=265543 /ORGANISM="Minutocellus polymorphus, Strain NH13" /LENGTH=1023 /DNA_ID=CAMNT_0023155957 /DNA_START=570 /DNA_END=3641 /DNA_ORIENTATION=-
MLDQVPTAYSAEGKSVAGNVALGGSPLLSLPVDSLHCIASFLTPIEWSNLGQAGRGASNACREIFRRVRMHGFRCATEIVTAWFRGEHSDARELAALYISSGVPVYPLCRSYSYRTLTWRMSVEAKELISANESSGPRGTSGNGRRRGGSYGNDGTGMPSGDAPGRVENSFAENNAIGSNSNKSDCGEIIFPILDKFYSDRDEAREGGGYYHPGLTYLEEKCLFWQHLNAKEETPDGPTFLERRRHSLTSSVALRPSTAQRQSSGITQQDQRHLLSEHATLLPPRRTVSSNNLAVFACLSTRNGGIRHRPLCSVRIHRHLADRHLLGRTAVADDDGKMKAVSLCLGADFFHPHFSSASVFRSANSLVRTTNSEGLCTVSPLDHGQNALLSGLEVDGTLTEDDSTRRNARENDARSPQASGAGTNLIFSVDHVTPDVDLDVYSSASMGVSKVQRIHTSDSSRGESCQKQCIKDNLPFLSLRSRIGFYQRKLDSHLAHYQSVAFDECLLDFWDEFLPSTKGIHFHDGHTPIPRMFDLSRFLTNPCPKSYGTIQCEIERIKTTSSKKGVGMKGRLFPSYQYRLFIRDRRGEDEQMSADQNDQSFPSPRNDTVLMTAKNKDKHQIKASSSSGQSTSGSVGKRGVSNYYLYAPTDRDIQCHYVAVNDVSALGNGSSRPCQRLFPVPAGRVTPREIGRLQSNFIGTEFQIFTPSSIKRQNRPTGRGFSQSSRGYSRSSSFDSASGSEMEVASTVSQDTHSSLYSSPSRSSIVGQIGLQSGLVIAKRSRSRRSSNVSGSGEVDDMAASGVPCTFQQSRRRSWPSLRYSRRAIAHDSGGNHPGVEDISSRRQHAEEEVGVITYTANLLGNRPRIMDVCIPKISDEGIISAAWKSHIDAALEMGLDETMMSRFKQLQHFSSQEENFEGNVGPNNSEGGVQGMTPSEFGLLALQNRPPWWNAELGAFVLNFGGRVSVASVKNFQLSDRTNRDFVMLQFGRIEGRHSFTMDFQHPLSATQAFAMQVSNNRTAYL